MLFLHLLLQAFQIRVLYIWALFQLFWLLLYFDLFVKVIVGCDRPQVLGLSQKNLSWWLEWWLLIVLISLCSHRLCRCLWCHQLLLTCHFLRQLARDPLVLGKEDMVFPLSTVALARDSFHEIPKLGSIPLDLLDLGDGN